MQDAVWSVVQTLTALDNRDPRLSARGKLDYRLQLQYRYNTRQDPPPNRVKPILVQILRAMAAIAAASDDPKLCADADMIILALFFLLRPGEYTGTKSTSTSFCLCEVILSVGYTVFLLASSEEDLLTATFTTLVFTTQENGVRGEKIRQATSRNPLLCPWDALLRRMLHLKNNGADPTTPISEFIGANGR